ncbi:MAG: hypothetical protein LBQ52_03350 [Helicobacteraceae bacterium]|jgi:tRNA U34 5-methylaminomethyl-2-thiouridine-forming methyltransferase MnmC|nr:hypothetical protein [Helicobacteraceae bacterium]
MRLIKTVDNVFTLFSDRFNESYHSVGEGAMRETIEKHIRPAFTYAQIGDRARVLDVCFGLGYNALAALDFFGDEIEIVSPEIDKELIAYLPRHLYPIEFEKYRPMIAKIASDFYYKDDRVSIEVKIGDAADIIQELEGEFDVIFQDPFSIRNNGELWSEQFFAALYRLLRSTGVLTTYSASHLARTRMKNAGFFLYAHSFTKESGLRRGTIASKIEIEELKCLRV